ISAILLRIARISLSMAFFNCAFVMVVIFNWLLIRPLEINREVGFDVIFGFVSLILIVWIGADLAGSFAWFAGHSFFAGNLHWLSSYSVALLAFELLALFDVLGYLFFFEILGEFIPIEDKLVRARS